MIKRLDELEQGEEAVIISVSGDSKVRRRLFDMGVTPNAKVVLKKKAPLGDPIEVTIRGYELSLRKDEAKNVEIEVKE